jgi:hypothetical protein
MAVDARKIPGHDAKADSLDRPGSADTSVPVNLRPTCAAVKPYFSIIQALPTFRHHRPANSNFGLLSIDVGRGDTDNVFRLVRLADDEFFETSSCWTTAVHRFCRVPEAVMAPLRHRAMYE